MRSDVVSCLKNNEKLSSRKIFWIVDMEELRSVSKIISSYFKQSKTGVYTRKLTVYLNSAIFLRNDFISLLTEQNRSVYLRENKHHFIHF